MPALGASLRWDWAFRREKARCLCLAQTPLGHAGLAFLKNHLGNNHASCLQRAAALLKGNSPLAPTVCQTLDPSKTTYSLGHKCASPLDPKEAVYTGDWAVCLQRLQRDQGDICRLSSCLCVTLPSQFCHLKAGPVCYLHSAQHQNKAKIKCCLIPVFVFNQKQNKGRFYMLAKFLPCRVVL